MAVGADNMRTARGYGRDRCVRLGVCAWKSILRPQWRCPPSPILFVLCVLCCLPAVASAQTPAGTQIDNVALASYTANGEDVDLISNVVTIVTVARRTPSRIEFLKYAPGSNQVEMLQVATTSVSISGTGAGPFLDLPPPIPLGETEPLDLSGTLPLCGAYLFHRGEPVFLRMTDPDQNLDPTVPEKTPVTLQAEAAGDSELLLLTETGPGTGVFVGYIQSAEGRLPRHNDGLITVRPNLELDAYYVDPVDPGDSCEAPALVDPYGLIFDSSTGFPVSDAEVTLIDLATGQPAIVFGDDGASSYPASVVSGGTVIDGKGTVYNFPPGAYRFPFVPPGDYRLQVQAASGYVAPSTVPTDRLQSLPGGPFSIAEPGSRGEPFPLNPGPTLYIDIPIDPVATGLSLVKTSGKQQAAIGDFLPYGLRLQNQGDSRATDITIADRLPLGFRYRTGSTRIGDVVARDPGISDDGRTLSFRVDTLAAHTAVDVHYVVEVGAGAPTGDAVNAARASDPTGLSSNVAKAIVHVREEFFADNCFIVGRVIADNCGDLPTDEADGVTGVRIFLEDGTYCVTDPEGRYHFEGVPAGNHVVQLDLVSLPDRYEIMPCEKNSRFAGRAHSQFVDLRPGSLWRADFHLTYVPEPVPEGEAGLELSTILSGQNVGYRIDLRGTAVPLSKLRLSISLPEQLEYLAGSSRLDGEACPDPDISDNVLIYRLADAPADWRRRLSFETGVVEPASSGTLITQAFLMFDSPTHPLQKTPVIENLLSLQGKLERDRRPDVVLRPRFATLQASLRPEDRAELDSLAADLASRKILHIHVEGHTDSVRIAPRSRHIFANNYELSMARARTVAEHLARSLRLAPDGITMVGRGPDIPVATNRTAAGRFMNRRVELRVETEEIMNEFLIQPLQERSDTAVKTVGLPASRMRAAVATLETAQPGIPAFDKAWLESQEPGRQWLWPQPDYLPAIPSLKLAVKHAPQQRLELLRNGVRVDQRNFESMTANQNGTVAVSLWNGVDLEEGDNRFEVVACDETGSEVWRLQRSVHYSGPPVYAELLADQSALKADGRTVPVVAVRLTDKDGYAAREGVIGEFTLDPPFATLQELEAFQQNPLVGMTRPKPHYVVGSGGVARIELQPTGQPGEAVLHFQFADFEQEIRTRLFSEQRDWILVGLAEGTTGYNTVTGHLENLTAADVDEDYYLDGRLAFYAKGAIKGQWLLTMAYDSAADEGEVGGKLHQVIDPDSYYTLYGDAAQQGYDAPSVRKLYVRLERRQFYALFGDYDTGLTVNELARYSRQFNGFKSELHLKRYDFQVHASQTGHAFVKDEIQGDGTSGLYRLTQGRIVPNSETIAVETRDRFRSEEILSTRKLHRHIDYSIDYAAGTLFFKEPIFSRDEAFNPVFIVADYETREDHDDFTNYGARAVAAPLNRRVELGTTYIHEEQRQGDGDLLGFDAKLRFTPKTELKSEFVLSDTDFAGRRQAYLAEIWNHTGSLDGKMYLREQEEDFGLGQQNRSEKGTRKLGFDLDYKVNPELKVTGQAFRQYNLATDAERDLLESGAQWRDGDYSFRSSVRHASDRFSDAESRQSIQFGAGGSVQTLRDRLLLSLEHDQSLGSRNQSADYPTRTRLGGDYKLNPDLNLLGRLELTNGGTENTRGARIGMKTTPWTGAEFGSAWEHRFTEHGQRAFANLGLRQLWRIDPRWSVDVGLDHSSAVTETGHRRINENVSPASGTADDFTAVSIGANYRAGVWQWNQRFEMRFSDLEDKWGLTPNVLIEPKRGLGLAGSGKIFKSETAAGAGKTDSDIRLSLALRPRNSQWIVLDRLDWITSDQRGMEFATSSWRVVNNLHLNYRYFDHTQIALQLSAKYYRDHIDGRRYAGTTDLFGAEVRRNLGRRWDVGLRGGWLHSWNSGQIEYSTGLSVGLNVMADAWISLGYNVTGFEDDDFAAGNFTAKGPFLRFRLKFDQESVQEALKQFGWIRQ